MSIIAALLAFAPPSTALTINDGALGKPEEFRTAGPARVCMRELAIDAKVGESVYLSYAGIHYGILTLIVGDKSINFKHGEIWVLPKHKGKLIRSMGGIKVYRTHRNGGLSYLVTTPREVEPGKPSERAVVWIEGDMLTGKPTDLEALSRMSLETDPAKNCDRTYSYGWSMLFGEEPLSTKKAQ